MLSEEKLTELFRYSFSLIDSRMTPNQQAFCRAIESAATTPLLAEIERLTRELEEARKDAERYQKIIAVCESDGFGYWLPEICLKEGNLPPSKQESDAAIDAAIKEQT